jgi:hypothetical protein
LLTIAKQLGFCTEKQAVSFYHQWIFFPQYDSTPCYRIHKSYCLQSAKYLARTQNNCKHHKKSKDSVQLTNQDTNNMLTKIHDNKGSQRNETLQSVQLMTTAYHKGRKSIYQTYNKFAAHVLGDTDN